jgi:toluene monooxygenase system ferredoxin subunit
MPQNAALRTDSEILDALGRTALLHDVKAETMRKIAAIARWVSCEDGDALYEMGDQARNLYVVVAGRLRFTFGGGSRIEGEGSVIVPGDTLGWAALVADLPRRIATVVGLERSRLLEIEGRALLRIFDADPAAGYLVMQRLTKMITQNFLEQSRRLSVS